jgi:hypothetical protein
MELHFYNYNHDDRLRLEQLLYHINILKGFLEAQADILGTGTGSGFNYETAAVKPPL